MTDSPGSDRPSEPDRGSFAAATDARLPGILVMFATVMAGLFMLLGFIVFFGGWGSASDLTDDAWLQLMEVGKGALPYFIAGGVFWLIAEYKTVHRD